MNEELQRYQRHLKLPGFEVAHQDKLTRAKVLVIGAGGLGTPVLQYLTAMGVGTLGIVDDDRIELSNIHRQVMYGDGDVGQLKVEVISRKLSDLHPQTEILIHPLRLTTANAREIIRNYDLVVDGSDNLPTRYLVNDVCVLESKPLIYGSIYRFEGQVSVFNHPPSDPQAVNYRDLFPQAPHVDMAPNCAEGGVLGVLPGIIGSMQAAEAVKVISEFGEVLSGKLLLYELQSHTTRKVAIVPNAQNPLRRSEGIDPETFNYEAFCGLESKSEFEVDQNTILQWKAAQKDFELIDVRTAEERAISHIGGIHIPLDELKNSNYLDELKGAVVFYCQSGMRSRTALEAMLASNPRRSVFHLKGGVSSWTTS